MDFINLGKHKVSVSVSNGIRMIKHSDVRNLLGLKEGEYSGYFIDAKFVTDSLFENIYITKNATKEQQIIFKGLCIVGIYSLIDEVCKIDLRGISYINEFNDLLKG